MPLSAPVGPGDCSRRSAGRLSNPKGCETYPGGFETSILATVRGFHRRSDLFGAGPGVAIPASCGPALDDGTVVVNRESTVFARVRDQIRKLRIDAACV